MTSNYVRSSLPKHLWLGMVAVLAMAALPLLAQGDPSVPQADTTTLWGMWKVGGVVMYPIMALCIAAVTLAVYGFINTPEKKMLTPHLIPMLQTEIENLNLQEVQSICNANPSMLTNIVAAGLQRIGDDGTIDVPTMEGAMEEASVEETAAGLKLISFLSIIAQLAPMLGLLGTVTGMIKAFQGIAGGDMGRPEKLAGYIGEAMITTAFGLIVGIPAMYAYFHLKGRYNSNVARMSRVLGNLVHRLSEAHRKALESGGGVKTGSIL